MQERHRPRAILLDLDDTVYPERSYFESGLVAVADWIAGDDPAERREWRRRLSQDARQQGRAGVLDRIPHPADRTPEAWRATLLQVYRTHEPRISAFTDVEAFIDAARQAGCRLGVVTDGKSCVQWRKLAALGLPARVDAVVCSDDIDRPKPAVEPFLVAATLLGVPAEACVYVSDDASKDFIGPRRLGMATIQVSRSLPFPLARPAPDTAAEAARRVTSLAEAGELLFGAST